MCGLTGFFRAGDPEPIGHEERAALQRMCDAITHRGPDEEGIWTGPGVGLAARRLSIIDVAASHQPQWGPSGKTVCVFNGEIYNYRAIRDELIGLGHTFQTDGDTEVLPHGYEAWGIDGLLGRLNGMFGFAIWDGRSGELFVARDRLGIKPMHVGRFGDTWVFGSELKSLLLHPAVPREVSVDALARYLMFEYVPSPRSIYTGIEKLLPAHYLRVHRDGTSRKVRYWTLHWDAGRDAWHHPEVPLPPEGADRERDWVPHLLHVLRDATKARLVSEVPIGALLSGGLDSSAIAALMAEEVPDLRTFSIGFEEESFDEAPFAQMVADRIGSKHTARVFSQHEFTDALEAVRGFVDEPFADASILPTWFLSKTVKEQGTTVVLSGDGADELFAGYPTYNAQLVARRLMRAPGMGPMLTAAGRVADRFLPSSFDNISTDYKIRRFLAGAPMPDARRHATWLGSFLEGEMRGVLAPDVVAQLAEDTPWSEVDAVSAEPDTYCAQHRLMHQDLRTYMGDDILVKVDRASMANSLEVRTPFLDHRVVEMAARIPFALKVKADSGKHILKRAMGAHLPPQVIKRPKKGFGMPVAHWLKGPWKDLLVDTLGGGAAGRTGFFHQPAVDALIADHLSGRRDRRKPLWTLLMFHWWLGSPWGPSGT